jgi:hypothetical protein
VPESIHESLHYKKEDSRVWEYSHLRVSNARLAYSVPEAWRRPDYSRSLFLQHRTSKPIEAASVISAKFERLVSEWQSALPVHSSVTSVAMHPSYQKMIGMGSSCIPYILRRLSSEGDEPNDWFWALAAIADENPVPEESRGSIIKMSKAWLEWGARNGYISLD